MALAYMYDTEDRVQAPIVEDYSIWRVDEDQTLEINPHEGQMRLLLCKARIIAVIAGNQSGKTVSGPIWLYFEIKHCGPGEYGVVSPTFKLMDKKTLPEFKKLFGIGGLDLGVYVDSKKEFRFSRAGLIKMFGTWKYPSGKPLECIVRFGYAEDPDSLESMTLKGCWCDESGQDAFKLGSFQALDRRCARFGGRILHTTTPYSLGALKTQVWDLWNAGDPTIEVINFSSIMNPFYPKEEYYRQKEILPPWKFALFYDGIFTKPTGTIYDIYNDYDKEKNPTGHVHKIRRFLIPKHWKRLWGTDFGNVNFACIKIAVNPKYDPDSPDPMKRYRLYVYSTYKTGNKSVIEHVKALMITEREGINFYVCGGSDSEDDWRSKFAAAGLFIHEPYIKSVEAGIDSVYEKLKLEEIAIFDDLEGLDTELRTYTRKLDKNDEVTEEIDNKSKFHRLDALRYIISQVCKNPEIMENDSGQDDTWLEDPDDQ